MLHADADFLFGSGLTISAEEGHLIAALHLAQVGQRHVLVRSGLVSQDAEGVSLIELDLLLSGGVHDLGSQIHLDALEVWRHLESD